MARKTTSHEEYFKVQRLSTKSVTYYNGRHILAH